MERMSAFTWPPDDGEKPDDPEEPIDTEGPPHFIPRTPFEEKLLDRAKKAAWGCFLRSGDSLFDDAVSEFVCKVLAVHPETRADAQGKNDSKWAQRYVVGRNAILNFLYKRGVTPAKDDGPNPRVFEAGNKKLRSLSEMADQYREQSDDDGTEYANDADFVAGSRDLPPDVGAMLSELRFEMKQAVKVMTTRHRQIFKWAYVDRMTNQAIADALGLADEKSIRNDRGQIEETLMFKLAPFKSTLAELEKHLGADFSVGHWNKDLWTLIFGDLA